jgi:hypothetical protein
MILAADFDGAQVLSTPYICGHLVFDPLGRHLTAGASMRFIP